MNRSPFSSCRSLVASVVAGGVLVLPAPRAAALFGAGDIVYDPAAFGQMAEQLANQVIEIAQKAEDLASQYAQVQNQTRQIQLQVQSLQNLDFSNWRAASRSAKSLRGRWAAVGRSVRIQRDIVEGWYDEVFPGKHPDVVEAEGLEAIEEHQARQREAERDVARASALSAAEALEGMESRAQELEEIGRASDNAEGTKAAVQANSQVVGELVAELQALHLTMLAQERRELVRAARESDEAELARQQREAYHADSGAAGPQPPAAVPVRR